MEKQTVTVNGTDIAVYQSKGTGPAIMLVHGNSASSKSYRHQIEGPFGEAFRVVSMDLPGHGESSPAADPPNTYTFPGYARVVAEVAGQLGLTNAVFVGWSLGGHILLEAVDLLPDAAGFVIFGTPPVAFPPAMDTAFLPNPAMGAAFSAELSDEEAAAFAAALLKPGAEVPAEFVEDVKRTDGQARAIMAGSIAPGGYKDEIELVANMTKPLAILHGEHEQLVSEPYISALTMPTLWRGAVQIIADAGHAPHWEQPEQFNELLRAFVREVTG